MKKVTTPLRYPGGKSKAITQILQYLPSNISEYKEFREPFIGGGSVFIYFRQHYPFLKFWINDLNYDLYCFWKQAQENLDKLVYKVSQIKENELDGRDLYKRMTEVDLGSFADLDRAVRFFILNRITFSGTVDCGGYSQKAFEQRFTNSSIVRLQQMKAILEGVVITNFDYSELLKDYSEKVFIFLDPPYFAATNSKLYGKKGDLHTGFDHTVFAQLLKICPHNWLITYDDSPEIRNNFNFANLYEWELQYGMNNYMKAKAAKGKELFISNYDIKSSQINQLLIPSLT